MKLNEEMIKELDRLQRMFNLSAAQVARYAAKRYRVKVTRQAVWARLNDYSLKQATGGGVQPLPSERV